MDADAKKTALRMIPYGLYVLTAEGKDGKVAAATVNWVTQTAFQPPLVVVGVKTDSGAHAIIKETKTFALNILGKDQKNQAFTFFKSLEREGNTIGGEPFRKGSLGARVGCLPTMLLLPQRSSRGPADGGYWSSFIAALFEAGTNDCIQLDRSARNSPALTAA